MSESMVNQRHDRMTGKVKHGVLKSSHRIYVSYNSLNIPIVEKYDLAARRSVSVVPIRFRSIRKHLYEDSQETNLRKMMVRIWKTPCITC